MVLEYYMICVGLRVILKYVCVCIFIISVWYMYNMIIWILTVYAVDLPHTESRPSPSRPPKPRSWIQIWRTGPTRCDVAPGLWCQQYLYIFIHLFCFAIMCYAAYSFANPRTYTYIKYTCILYIFNDCDIVIFIFIYTYYCLHMHSWFWPCHGTRSFGLQDLLYGRPVAGPPPPGPPPTGASPFEPMRQGSAPRRGWRWVNGWFNDEHQMHLRYCYIHIYI